jgi:GPH family glycoside/pentoside/hexuronide:cation symporter
LPIPADPTAPRHAPPPAGPARTPRATLLAYAAPALPLAIMGLPLAVYLPDFWAGAMGLGLGVVGLALAAGRLLDVLADPLIGRLSDRLHGRCGRRKPFIALGLPVAGIGGLTLFFPPAGVGWLHLLLANAALMLGWSLLSLPYQAWGAELSPDYGERTRIASWRESGTLLGVLASLVLPAALGRSASGPTLHLLAALSVALALPAVLLLLVAVREPPPRPAAVQARQGLRETLRLAAANAPFRRLLAAWLVNGVANGLPAVLFLLLCRHLLHAPQAAGRLLLAYFLAGLAGIPFWTWLARRIGKHRAWACAMLFSCAWFIAVPLLRAGDVGWFLAICLGSGAGLGADLALPPAMQADVVDLDEARGGSAQAGLFFAAWTMAQKAGNALAAGIAFPLLGLAGFRMEGGNGAAAMAMLIGLYCVLPVALKLGAVALIWHFPIDAAAQAALRQSLAARRLVTS